MPNKHHHGAFPVTAGVWQRVARAFLPPAGATVAYVYMENMTASQGSVTFGADLGYFDGYAAGAKWSGLANASASVRVR